jgi:DNA polymerase
MLTHYSQINVSNIGRKVDRKEAGIWCRISTYGGCLAENATQAVARDVMAVGMPRVEAAGYPIIMTVHDELVTEPLLGHGSLEELCSLMVPIDDWAAGLPVSVAGFEAERYGKGE